jgi:hypothetical protein
MSPISTKSCTASQWTRGRPEEKKMDIDGGVGNSMAKGQRPYGIDGLNYQLKYP